MDPMDAIKQTFFQECDEQMAELEAGLLAIQAGEGDGETVNAVFRAVHSVKGGAGAFGLDALVRFAHVFESTLDKLRSDRMAPEPAVLKVLLRAADVLADQVSAARNGGEGDAAQARTLAEELAALDTGTAPDLAAEAASAPDPDGMDGLAFQPVAFALEAEPARRWSVRFRPHPALYAKANDAGLLLRELARLGPMEVQLDASALPELAELDPEGAYLQWTTTLSGVPDEAAIREVFEFVDGDCDIAVEAVHDTSAPPPAEDAPFDFASLLQLPPDAAAPQSEKAAPSRTKDEPAAAKPTIRVDLDRVDRLIDLVGELVINQAMLAQRVLESGQVKSSGVAMGLDELEGLTREIQESVMAIRAQPVKSVFQRMPRLAREVAALTGKQIRLITDGEGTEVDKTVIEHLADPLTHMIRNAIDHGVEVPDIRLAAGKPAEGTVRLSAAHRSGRIVIELSDDGAGINRPRVRAIAVAKGLVPADAVLTDEETDNLIFLPGFSTAETISDISGRGVGMDVVRRHIQAMGGRITIASRPGQGSTFTLSLPLTLAVLDGMVVSIGGQTTIVPLTVIVETLQPRPADVHGLGEGAMVIGIRGSYVPLIDVGLALGYRTEPCVPASCVALLIEGEGGGRAALLVDAIQGQRQVVIKSLEANYRHVPGVAAATILGDGRVALILDIDSIVAGARQEAVFEPHAEIGHAYA